MTTVGRSIATATSSATSRCGAATACVSMGSALGCRSMGGTNTTQAEYDATYRSLVALEPAVMSDVVASHAVNPNELTFVRKAFGEESHKGRRVRARERRGYVHRFVARLEYEHCGLHQRPSERTLKLRSRAIAWIAFTLALVVFAAARPAVAQERRIETAAKEALKRARTDFCGGRFRRGPGAPPQGSEGLRERFAVRRRRGRRSFGMKASCSSRRGEAGKAAALFAEAVRTDKKVESPRRTTFRTCGRPGTRPPARAKAWQR